MLKELWHGTRQKVGVFMPTLRCPITCGHCLLSCTPTSGESMTPEQIGAWVAEFIDLGFSPICLTGGEPFLCPKVLEAASAVCADRSVPLVVQTNGFWARSTEGGRRMLAGIPAIAQLGFSVDYAHLRFLPREVIEKGLYLAYERGILNLSLSISYQTTAEQEEIESYFRRRFPRLTVDAWPITPIGRALDNPDLRCEYEEYSWDFLPRSCEAQQCFTPLVYPNGDVHLCYHLLMCLGPGDPFLLGNLRERSFAQMMDDLSDPLYSFVAAYGGGSLGYLLEEAAPEFLGKRYQRVCQLCYAVFSQPRLVAHLREILSLPPFLQKMQEMLQFRVTNAPAAVAGTKTKLIVCRGKNCMGHKKNAHLKNYLTNRLLDGGKLKSVAVEGVDCMKLCKEGPNLRLGEEGDLISHVDVTRINTLIEAL